MAAERGGGASFALEALQRLPVFGKLLGQELECDEAALLGVLGLVHHTRAPATEPLQDAVVGDSRADHESGPRFAGI